MIEQPSDESWADRLGDPEALLERLQALLGELRPTRLGYGSPPDPKHYLDAFHVMFAICLHNNPQYQDSWCKRGAVGVFGNIARKFDRMDAQLEQGRPFEPNEIVDLAVYSWMNLAWYLKNDPARIVEWAKKEGLLPDG